MRSLPVVACLLFTLAGPAFAIDREAATFPANQWVELGKTKVVIPQPWQNGRLKGVNSYGSEVYCDALGEMLSMDGYTTAPAGKSTPNNYSDSLYGYNPATRTLRLIKRSNWRAGARSRDPSNCSYPLDENATDPTPCPRHTYNGLCYSTDTKKLYLINGANAGVPNAHPKFKANKGTGVFTFWALEVETNEWTRLTYPPVRRREPYETVLRAIPGTNALWLIGTWSVAKYDTQTATWKILLGNGPSPVRSGNYGCAATVDPKRKRIVLLNSAAKIRRGKPITDAQKHVSLRYFDTETNKFVPIPSRGAVEGKVKAGLAYVDPMDAYAVRTEKGLYLYFPEAGVWKKPAIEPLVPKGKYPYRWCYMNYDRGRDLLILSRRAALRLDAKTLRLTTLSVKKPEGS